MDRTYEDGVRDGKIEALEDITAKQGDRLDSHSRRLSRLERVIYALGGVVAFIEFAPDIRNLFG